MMRLLALVLVVVAGLIASACGSDSTATPSPSPTPRGSTSSAAPTPTPVPAFDPASYYAGQTVTVNVGFSPGGGYDIFSRIFANIAPKHMPGNPKFVVRNLPGSGGQRGLEATDRAPADGFTIGVLHPRFVKRELTGTDVEGFDLGAVNFIGSASAANNTNALYVRREIASSWDEIVALGRDLVNGETSPGASSGAGAAMVEIVGGPIKIVYGYGGSAEILAAFDRGELDLTTNGGPDSTPRLYPEWIEERYMVPVLRWGASPEEDPEWGPWLEQIGAVEPPHVLDVLDLTPDQEAVFRLSESIDDTFSRTFILHPDTPAEIVTAWQEAFVGMAADAEFIELLGIAGYEVGYQGPEEMVQAAEAGLQLLQDPELRDLFIQLAGAE